MEIIDIIYIVITLVGLGAAIFTQQKYAKAKENILGVIGDVADLLAMVYAASQAGSCDAATMQKIAAKIEEVWAHIEALGPSFEALLASKSRLADALKGGKP
jgi:hypothetical protein